MDPANNDRVLARVQQPDVQICSGVVHIVDSLILPQQISDEIDCLVNKQTVASRLDAPQLQWLKNALMNLGWVSALGALDSSYTVFAVADQAVMASDVVALGAQEMLMDALALHIVPNVMLRDVDFRDGLVLTTLLDRRITMHISKGSVRLSVSEARSAVNAWSTISDKSTSACNGVVHFIDKLILPPEFRTVAPTAIPTTYPTGAPSLGVTTPPSVVPSDLPEGSCARSALDLVRLMPSLRNFSALVDMAGPTGAAVLARAWPTRTVLVPPDSAYGSALGNQISADRAAKLVAAHVLVGSFQVKDSQSSINHMMLHDFWDDRST